MCRVFGCSPGPRRCPMCFYGKSRNPAAKLGAAASRERAGARTQVREACGRSCPRTRKDRSAGLTAGVRDAAGGRAWVRDPSCADDNRCGLPRGTSGALWFGGPAPGWARFVHSVGGARAERQIAGIARHIHAIESIAPERLYVGSEGDSAAPRTESMAASRPASALCRTAVRCEPRQWHARTCPLCV